jgi:putative ABC transport system permease protein
VLSSGLLAVATFLIASMSLFQMSPTQQGYGGFDLLAESSQPLYRNLSSPAVREETLGNKADAIRSTKILSFRARLRDDASCNNLFQAPEPTVLGVPSQMQQDDQAADPSTRFQWSAASDREQPWQALEEPATGASGSPIPVVLDQNTAAWSLHQGASLGAITKLQFEGHDVYFKTVGLLSNSILQGKLMISESNFTALFPSLSGYQFFMIRSADADPKLVTETIESGWSDNGMDVVSSAEVLRRLLSVQNTYISAFQSLGALGLLLGTLGLAAVQTRSVLERRKELALLRAVGFSNQRLAGMLTLETAILLVGGMAIGILSAAVAIVPYLIEVGPQSGLLQPFAMIGLILACGFVTAMLAIRTALKQPILAGLRSE